MLSERKMTNWIHISIVLLSGMTLTLAYLHFMNADQVAAGVQWYSLNHEGNLASWFAGLLYAVFAGVALTAAALERKINQSCQHRFQFIALWWVVAAIGLYIAIDEVVAFHENVLWYEIGLFSLANSTAWEYVTQWHIVYAPLVYAALAFLVVFFTQRFRYSPRSKQMAYFAIGCWLSALVLDAIEQYFIAGPQAWYVAQTLLEEGLEYIGAIAMIAAIAFYLVELQWASAYLQSRQQTNPPTLWDRPSKVALASFSIMMMVSISIVYGTVQSLADAQVATPNIIKKVQAKMVKNRFAQVVIQPKSIFNQIWFDKIQTTEIAENDMQATVNALLAAVQQRQLKSFQAWLVEQQYHLQPSIIFISLSDGSHAAQTVMGTGKTFAAAVNQAIDQISVTANNPQALKLEIVSQSETLPQWQPSLIQPGKQGVALADRARMVFLPEQVLMAELLNDNSRSNYHIKRLFQRRLHIDGTVYLFETKTFTAEHGSSAETHALPQQREVIAMASNYLARSVTGNGEMIQQYNPIDDSIIVSKDLLLNANAVQLMLKSFAVTKEPLLLKKSKLALSFLASQAEPCVDDEYTALCILASGTASDDFALNTAVASAMILYGEIVGDVQFQTIAEKLRKSGTEVLGVNFTEQVNIAALQYQMSNSFHVNSPEKVLGGLKRSATDPTVDLAMTESYLASSLATYTR